MQKRKGFNCSMPNKGFTEHYKRLAKKTMYRNLSNLIVNLLIWYDENCAKNIEVEDNLNDIL